MPKNDRFLARIAKVGIDPYPAIYSYQGKSAISLHIAEVGVCGM